MFDAAIASHVDGLPRYLSSLPSVRATSIVNVLPIWDYNALSSADILFNCKNLVVVGDDAEPRSFDSSTLSLLGSLEASVNIHDLSLDVSGPNRVKRGIPLDLLRTLDQQHPKALSGLSFPLCRNPFPPQKFSSDAWAWIEAQGKGFCKSRKPYPVPEMRWGLASTAGTYHYFHLDANGYGTFMTMDHGCKLWFFASPKNISGLAFDSIDLYTVGFKASESNLDLWDVELVVLQPGSKLIMRPNQPHAVCTPIHTVCRGSHYYAATTLRDTIAGIYHTTVAGGLLTNTDHGSASRAVLMQILTTTLCNLVDDVPAGSSSQTIDTV
ncbi:hypothetical protein C0993_001117 [Termitomyces sp. T159_Od127]|nr:hypothetical protein C0993_001117 [Termitomyces sp. T159_Od127]